MRKQQSAHPSHAAESYLDLTCQIVQLPLGKRNRGLADEVLRFRFYERTLRGLSNILIFSSPHDLCALKYRPALASTTLYGYVARRETPKE